jgi:YD repeat-containing protein
LSHAPKFVIYHGAGFRIDEPKGAWLTHHYDSIGNLIKTVVGGVTTTMEYDIRGNKTKMNDPDMGTWTYSYNATLRRE